MQRHLVRREAHFFAMFARMEQAMSQAHNQMDALWAFAAG
jgi:flagellar capping protein FliD